MSKKTATRSHVAAGPNKAMMHADLARRASGAAGAHRSGERRTGDRRSQKAWAIRDSKSGY